MLTLDVVDDMGAVGNGRLDDAPIPKRCRFA